MSSSTLYNCDYCRNKGYYKKIWTGDHEIIAKYYRCDNCKGTGFINGDKHKMRTNSIPKGYITHTNLSYMRDD